MPDKYAQELPKEVESKLDAYIERIKVIKWFQPAKDLKRDAVDTVAKFAVKTFGLEASIEYRSLKTPQDWDAARDAAWGAARGAAWGAAWDAAWDAARDAAWDAAWGAARGAARDAARGAAWDAAWDAARGAARGAAWDAAWGAAWDAAWGAARGAADILALELDAYKAKCPEGNFINLIPLYEMGLYPVGVIDGKMVIYVPASSMEFPEDLISDSK